MFLCFNKLDRKIDYLRNELGGCIKNVSDQLAEHVNAFNTLSKKLQAEGKETKGNPHHL
jgi:hypothetical protein